MRLRFGTFEVDLRSGALVRSGRHVPLQRQPFELLGVLLEQPGAVVSREELRARLWPVGTFVDFEHGLNTYIRKIRRALEDSAQKPRYIETLPKRGYRFLASVQRLPLPMQAVESPSSPTDSLCAELELLPDGDGRRPSLLGRLGLSLAWSGTPREAVRVASQAGEAIAVSQGAGAAAEYLAEAADAVWLRSYSPLAWRLAEQGLRQIGKRRDWTWARLATHRLMASEATNPELPGLPADSPMRREIFAAVLANRHRFSAFEQNETWRSQIFDSRGEVLAKAGDQPGCLAFLGGEYRSALRLFRGCAARSLERGEIAGASMLFAMMSFLGTALGEFDEAEACCDDADALIVRGVTTPLTGLRLILASADGWHALTRGEGVERALSALEGVLGDLAGPITFSVAPFWVLAGLLHAYLGNRERSCALLDVGRPAIDRGPAWATNYTVLLGSAVGAVWWLGECNDVGLLERNLRSKTLASDFRAPLVDARLSLARLCALTGRCDEATEWFARAREILDQQTARPLRAITDLDEAWMYVRRGERGDRERALPLLDAACAQFDAIGMPGWLRRAEQLRLPSRQEHRRPPQSRV